MFTKFPQTAPFLPIHKDAYNSFTSEFVPHSDLSFGTLMIWWNLSEDLEVAELKGNVVLTYTNPFMEQKRCFTLIGTHDVDESIQTIFDYQRQHHLEIRLHLTPDYTVQLLKHPGKLRLEEDAGNTDYVLSTKRMAELTESVIGKTRRKVRHFLRATEDDVEVKELPLHSISEKMQVINSLHQWDRVYATENDRSRYEGLAINKALLLSDLIGIQCLAIFIHGKIEAFVLYRKLPQANFAIANHLKTSFAYQHIFDFTLHALSKKLLEEHIEYLNIEQDLGLSGLRFYKQNLQPVMRLKKYDIYPA